MGFVEKQGCLYWIHLPEHDIKTGGYIGISLNAEKRFREHKSTNANCSVVKRAIDKHEDDLIYDVLWEGSYEGALQLEEYYRPEPQIGWNIRKGGISPLFGEETRRKMSEIAKKRGMSKSCRDGHKSMRDSQNGMNAAHLKPMNIFKDNVMIAENVCASEWCRENGYNIKTIAGGLHRTARGLQNKCIGFNAEYIV